MKLNLVNQDGGLAHSATPKTGSNQVVASIAEIDRLAEQTKRQTFKLLDERGAIGFLDIFGRDMGREALDYAYKAIDGLAAKQRAEVIDLLATDSKPSAGHSEAQE